MYGVSSTPGVGGLISSIGRRMIVPSEDALDTGFLLTVLSLLIAIAGSPSTGYLFLIGLSGGMVASACTASRLESAGSLCLIGLSGGMVASDCRASRLASADRVCIGGVSYRRSVLGSSLLDASEARE